MSTYIDPIRTMLQQNYPQDNGLWNYSADNQLATSWLLATPTSVWGLPYAQFKQAVPGSGPLELATCTVPGPVQGQPTQLCQAMDASMTAPGQTPAKLLIGHSDAIIDAMYDVMISASMLLDVTTLSPPDGRFLDSLKNALKYLSNKPAGERPIVRILVSNPWPNNPPLTVGPFIKDLTGGLDPSKGLRVYCFVMSSSFSSWNHAKIVVADGVRAVVGGTNQFSNDYLGINPVHDVSMRITGTAARHSQDFANSMWVYGQWYKDQLPKWVQDYNPYITAYMSAYAPTSANGPSQIQTGVLPPATMYSTATAAFPAPPSGGTVPVLAVGRGADTKSAYLLPVPDSYERLFNEPADEAIVKLISLAQRTIRMSVQTFRLFRLVSAWNPEILAAMGAALNRGVTITAVTSNPGAKPGDGKGDSYDSDPPSRVVGEVVSTMVERLGLTEAAAQQIAAQRLSVATFRYSADATYPLNMPIGNHAKTVIVDDAAFYIGSQNMYTCDLNEFGFIVEDAAAAQSYVTNYWTPLWNWSKVTATSTVDPDVDNTHEVEAMQFIMALPLDSLLNGQWTNLLNRYNAATTPAAKAAIEASMDQLITSADFDTTTTAVLTGLQQPFFTETPPSTTATPEALRFVVNLMNSPQLIAAFNKIVMAPYPTVDAANTAITSFLKSNGYSCTALEVVTAFSVLQNKTLAYWTGTYTIWLTDDGGLTYANVSNQAASAHTLQARSVTDGTALPALGPSLVVTGSGVTYDGVAVKNPTYNNNKLTWSTADGNATSASIQFGMVTRATLNDDFTGAECFGAVTYPGSGGSGYQGTYSLYGRVLATPSGGGSGSGDGGSNTVLIVVGVLVLVGMVAMIAWWGTRKIQLNREWQRVADHKDNSDDELPDDDEFDPVSSPGKQTETAVVEDHLIQDQVSDLTGMLRRLSLYESGMTQTERVQLESAGTAVRDAQSQLKDPPAAELPSLVKTVGGKLSTVISNLKGIVTAQRSRFSGDTEVELDENVRFQSSISDIIGRINDQSQSDEPLEFDEPEEVET
jgi:phosphatidylserine/phosphatidylglycerophosphate/cardiolipin synthase-like enzyme